MNKMLLNKSRKSSHIVYLSVFFCFLFSVQSYATTNCGNITSFKFSNGNSSTTITNNGSYALSELPNNFYIDVIVNGFSESSRIRIKNLDTGQEVTIVENYLPYTFPAGNNAWNYGAGTYEIKSKIFKYNYGNGYACDTDIIRFTLTNTPSCGQIDAVEFTNGINAVAIVDGASYDMANIPSNFNINVIVSGMTESAHNTLLNMDNGAVVSNTENVLPYTFPGATNQVWTFGTGTFRFCSKVYKYDNLNGQKCDDICVTFTLYEDSCGSILEFQFADNGVNTPTAIVDGGLYNINDLPANFYINGLVSGDSESFKYSITNTNTGEVYNITENYIDYTFPAGNNAWFLGTGTFEVKGTLYSDNYCGGTICDEQIITFTLTDGPIEEVCEAQAGVTVTDETEFVIVPGVDNPVVTIIPESDTMLPAGYSYATLLSKGNNTVIRYFATGLSLELEQPGTTFKVHLLVYDNDLDLNTIVLGVTTIQDLLNTIANNDICASLDENGVPILIINAGVDEKTALENVKEKSVTTDIKLYPNPVANHLNIELLLLDREIMQYNMLDLNGREVLSSTFNSSTLGKTKIDTGVLSNGLYILNFKSNFRTFSKKIEVSK